MHYIYIYIISIAIYLYVFFVICFLFSFRTKQVTAEKVVESFIKRCKEVNGLINAIVEERYADAIEEAKAVDIELKGYEDTSFLKETKPFLGVPFTTKESNEAEGKYI